MSNRFSIFFRHAIFTLYRNTCAQRLNIRNFPAYLIIKSFMENVV